MKIILPFKDKDKWIMTQKFGEKFLYGGKIAIHQGVDWAMPKGTLIIAPFAGKVVRTTPERKDSYGQAIYLQADDQTEGKIEALCAHLSEIRLYPGIHVKQGEALGYSGNSGFWRGLNGYHLHYGLKVNGYYIDPLTFYKKINHQVMNLFNKEDEDVKEWLGAYTIKPGDTLWKIAEQYYKSGIHYNEIFLANQDVLPNPNSIKPGQILRIPALKNKGI